MLKKNNILKLCFSLQFLVALFSFGQYEDQKLWYNKPAEKWTDALPIGNGRLGAMIYGGINEEHVQFNEETLWTGRPREYQRNGAFKYLQPIRQLLFDGKQQEAEDLAAKQFMGVKDIDDSVYALQKLAWFSNVRSAESVAAVILQQNVWKDIQLPTPNGWESSVLEGVDGSLWFKTNFELPEKWLGQHIFIDLGRIRDVDFTYINGQQIGSSEGISTKRHYKIPASVLQAGTNLIMVQVINYFDKGGFTGLKTGRPFIMYPADEISKDTLKLNTMWEYIVQNDNPPAYPQYEASYQPFADVFFRFQKQEKLHNYRRELNLRTAVSNVTYSSNNIDYKREYFASAPEQTIVMHFTSGKLGRINLSAYFNCLHKGFKVKKTDDSTLALLLEVRNGALKGASYLRVHAKGGKVIISDNKIVLKNVNEATFYLTAATNFISYKDISGNAESKALQTLQRMAGKYYTDIKANHIKEYQHYYNSFAIEFGKAKKSLLPTDEIILNYINNTDAGPIALYMQYARYLLISSSRPGTQPANLQGIWNDNPTPSWGSKYTTNINLEMNYWPADVLNLSACNEPLFKMLKELAEAGKKTAKEHYNAKGWVLHHNTDLWRGTAPINAANHGIWPTGGVWLSQHIWQHYLFTNDKKFLQENYTVMKEASKFFLDYLIKDPGTGFFISTPSNSPEHGGLVAGPSMDHQIIYELFTNTYLASEVLGIHTDFEDIILRKKDSIAPSKIGIYGELQEWLVQKEDTAEHHRHVSHLWGVYPGEKYFLNDKQGLNAAKQSLLYRGDDGTGWSLAWKVNLWARFKDGNHAMLLLNKLLRPADDGISEKGGVYKNLFDAHPPFQIDGNFGGAAGIAEMLIQSHEGFIELLPALPSALSTGQVKGICARGGFVLNFSWKNGKLSTLEVLSKAGNRLNLKYGKLKYEFDTKSGMQYKFNSSLKPMLLKALS